MGKGPKEPNVQLLSSPWPALKWYNHVTARQSERPSTSSCTHDQDPRLALSAAPHDPVPSSSRHGTTTDGERASRSPSVDDADPLSTSVGWRLALHWERR
jgi:hypothetical protein